MPESKKIFEKIKHHTENGLEFWYARELQEALEYAKWGNFTKVIDKAKQSMKDNQINADEHITSFAKNSDESKKDIDDMILSYTACFYIAQSGDKRKKIITAAQQYFNLSEGTSKEPKTVKNVKKETTPKQKAMTKIETTSSKSKSISRSRQLKKVAKYLKK